MKILVLAQKSLGDSWQGNLDNILTQLELRASGAELDVMAWLEGDEQMERVMPYFGHNLSLHRDIVFASQVLMNGDVTGQFGGPVQLLLNDLLAKRAQYYQAVQERLSQQRYDAVVIGAFPLMPQTGHIAPVLHFADLVTDIQPEAIKIGAEYAPRESKLDTDYWGTVSVWGRWRSNILAIGSIDAILYEGLPHGFRVGICQDTRWARHAKDQNMAYRTVGGLEEVIALVRETPHPGRTCTFSGWLFSGGA